MSLYDHLEISKNATPADIKKAYHKMARKYHPDKNKEDDAVDKFKEIKNAYDVLSNADRRQLYDVTGGADTNQFFQNVFQNFTNMNYQNMEDFNFFGYDILNDLDVDAMFENINDILKKCNPPSPETRRREKNHLNIKAKETLINLNAKLEDIFTCQVKDVPITINKLIDDEIRAETVNFKIPVYLSEVIFENQGSLENISQTPGNIVISIYSKPHPIFKRIRQFDLLMCEKIQFSDIYREKELKIKHLDGKDIHIKISAKTLLNSQIIKINSQGLPKNCRQKKGDLYIYFKIQFPIDFHTDLPADLPSDLPSDIPSDLPIKIVISEKITKNPISEKITKNLISEKITKKVVGNEIEDIMSEIETEAEMESVNYLNFESIENIDWIPEYLDEEKNE